MPSSITANLNYPYLAPWWVANDASGGNGIAFTFTTSVANVGTHPFSTGDKIWVTLRTDSARIRYVIKVSDTQISLATSLANAVAGSPITLDSNYNNCLIGNVPSTSEPSPPKILSDDFLSYSKSAQSFAVTENVAIDFTVPNWGQLGRGLFNLFYWSLGVISDAGNYKFLLWIGNGKYWIADSVLGGVATVNFSPSSLTFNCRILLQNQRVSFQVKNTGGSYITVFTSPVLSTNIQGLRFFVNLNINGTALTNCAITYL